MKDKININPSSGLSKEELIPFYSLKSTPELLEILYHKDQYTEVAVQIALEELQARKITKSEFQEFDVARIIGEYEERKKEFIYRLTFWEQAGCYLTLPILLPIIVLVNRGFSRRYADNGFRIKAKEATIFTGISFLSLVVALVLNLNIYITLSIWAMGFTVALWLNIRLIKKVNADNLQLLSTN